MIIVEVMLAGIWIGSYVAALSKAGISSWICLFTLLHGIYALVTYGKDYAPKKAKQQKEGNAEAP